MKKFAPGTQAFVAFMMSLMFKQGFVFKTIEINQTLSVLLKLFYTVQ